MRVLYDHQIFSLQRYGGISRYFHEIATRLADFEGCEVSILALAHINGYLPGMRPGVVSGRRVPAVPRTARARRRINDALTQLCLRRHPPDIVHESYFSSRRLTPRGVKTVVTVYDMIPEKLPEYFPPGATAPRDKMAAVARARHVICISESTRKDLIEHIPVAASKVSVIHLAHSFRGRGSVSDPPIVSGPYLLYVGQRSGYKNFTTLLHAVADSAALRRGVRLVAFGGGRMTRAEATLAAKLGVPGGSVVHLEGSDETLANLYAHAGALVYPSLYEGFGIPPLEAMSMECPVICSNTSSLPEVVGDAAELFDPRDAASVTVAIESVLGSAARSTVLRQRGWERAQRFSWDRCAAQTHAVYQSIL